MAMKRRTKRRSSDYLQEVQSIQRTVSSACGLNHYTLPSEHMRSHLPPPWAERLKMMEEHHLPLSFAPFEPLHEGAPIISGEQAHSLNPCRVNFTASLPF